MISFMLGISEGSILSQNIQIYVFKKFSQVEINIWPFKQSYAFMDLLWKILSAYFPVSKGVTR